MTLPATALQQGYIPVHFLPLKSLAWQIRGLIHSQAGINPSFMVTNTSEQLKKKLYSARKPNLHPLITCFAGFTNTE